MKVASPSISQQRAETLNICVHKHQNSTVSGIFQVLFTDLDEVGQNLVTRGSHVVTLYILILTQHTIPMEEIRIRPPVIKYEIM
jgi:hypothetical protein